jgi:hypothetical protein
MSAPNQLPHHGGADQAGPTENENTKRSRFPWKPAHGGLKALGSAQRCFGRILRCSGVTQKSPKRTRLKKIPSQFDSV